MSFIFTAHRKQIDTDHHIQVFGRVLSAHFKRGISLAFNVIISQAWISSYKEEHFNRVDRLRAHEERLCT